MSPLPMPRYAYPKGLHVLTHAELHITIALLELQVARHPHFRHDNGGAHVQLEGI